VYYILEFMRFFKHYSFTRYDCNVFKVWWDIQSSFCSKFCA